MHLFLQVNLLYSKQSFTWIFSVELFQCEKVEITDLNCLQAKSVLFVLTM